jgi:hypothetical protein
MVVKGSCTSLGVCRFYIIHEGRLAFIAEPEAATYELEPLTSALARVLAESNATAPTSTDA